jgi:uncharacterized protein (TIGR02246 family)
MNKLVLPLVLFAVFSCAQKQDSTPSKTLDETIRADNTGDLEKLIENYTDDAILIPAGSTDIVGKNAIKEHYRNLFSNSSLELKATATEIIDGSDLTVIRGNTTGKIISKKDSSSAAVNDKFLMLLKKQSGKWKIYRLTWSKLE